MTKSKIPGIVASALKKGILPPYLKDLFWRAAGNNPFRYWRQRQRYFVSLYYLASICLFSYLERDRSENLIFKAGFPENLEVLKEKADDGLVQVASEVLAFQEIEDFEAAKDVRREFRMAFDAGKTLKLVPKEAAFGSYFRRAEKFVGITMAEILDGCHERFM
jgi:hypothetical protein